MSDIAVLIVDASVQAKPPGWRLEYEVRNSGSTPLWLVVHEAVKLSQAGRRIELSYARGRMRPGARPFGYFNPDVVQIEPGESARQAVEVTWPCRLSGLWNAIAEAAPPPGEYEVTVRIGYAMTPAPEAMTGGTDVEAPVSHWQHEAVSQPRRIAIPPYPTVDAGSYDHDTHREGGR